MKKILFPTFDHKAQRDECAKRGFTANDTRQFAGAFSVKEVALAEARTIDQHGELGLAQIVNWEDGDFHSGYCLVTSPKHCHGGGLLVFYNRPTGEFRPFKLKFDSLLPQLLEGEFVAAGKWIPNGVMLELSWKHTFYAMAQHAWLSIFVGGRPFSNLQPVFEPDFAHDESNGVNIRICRAEYVMTPEEAIIREYEQQDAAGDNDDPANDLMPA